MSPHGAKSGSPNTATRSATNHYREDNMKKITTLTPGLLKNLVSNHESNTAVAHALKLAVR